MLRPRRSRKWRPSLGRSLRTRRSPLPYRPYRFPAERLEPIDRPVTERDREWLKLVLGGPAEPPSLPPILPPTDFDRSWSSGGRRHEPLPFHPAWIVVALAVWASLWFSLYVASAYLYR
jgi:hypothetical protein